LAEATASRPIRSMSKRFGWQAARIAAGERAQAQLGEDGGYGHRVGDVRITALALLPAVAALRNFEGALDEIEIFLRVVGPDGTQKRFKNRRIACCAAAGQPGQPGACAFTAAREGWARTRIVHRNNRRGACRSGQPGLKTVAWSIIRACRWHRRRTFFQ